MGAAPSRAYEDGHVKSRRLRRRQEKSLNFQLLNLENAILESEENEALVWLSRILVMSSVDQMHLCRRVARLLVGVAAKDITSEDEKALKLAAAVWVTVREVLTQTHLQLSIQETLALVTIYLARATKGALVHDAMIEAHDSVMADNCVCRRGRRGGGLGVAPARGYAYPKKKLCHAINNTRKFLLRSDLENSLYWLSCSCLHIRRQTRPYSWRRRMMALELVAHYRGFAHDFVDDPGAHEIGDAAFSLFDYVPEKYEPCGDLRDLECVLALVIVRIAQAPKVDYVRRTFREILEVKWRMDGVPSASRSEAGASESGRSQLRTPKMKKEDEKQNRGSKRPKKLENGEDLSVFKFSTVKAWLRLNSERRGGASMHDNLAPEDAESRTRRDPWAARSSGGIIVSNSNSGT